MGYLPIGEHGIIGDLHSVALVGTNGCIDWCCLPHFDSPSVFASILDDKIGGYFKLEAEGSTQNRQMYLPDSNILVTRSYTPDGLGQIEDFMPIPEGEDEYSKVHQITRKVSCVRGEIRYHLDCRPAFDYARAPHSISLTKDGAIFETEGSYLFCLKSPAKLINKTPSVETTFTLKEGESMTFTFFALHSKSGDPFNCIQDTDGLLEKTNAYWQRWVSKCTYRGRWSEHVHRSALALKLLTFQPTGAIVAAPTMGLPEAIGGTRNWDYRYTWIRDASFTIYALMRIGYTEEAEAFMGWLSARCDEVDVDASRPLNLMYGIHGEHILPESELTHLSGYENSKPVRLGNAAYDQLQLDIYGELMDSIYIYNKYGTPISYKLWSNVRRMINWVAEHWDQPDEGIWETRGGQQNFVFSRLMCWVALDRATRMCIKNSLPGNPIEWGKERDKIYDQIMKDGWNEERQSFRQHYDTDALDAANLLMPLVKFISPMDPRMLGTIDATLETLTTDSLVYRYDPNVSPDGLTGEEGTFSICTFWLVECLTRAGRLSDARLLFQKMLGYSNHIGLYGEETGNHGETLGNFPQAFTHLSMISAAYNLDKALG